LYDTIINVTNIESHWQALYS